MEHFIVGFLTGGILIAIIGVIIKIAKKPEIKPFKGSGGSDAPIKDKPQL